MYYNKKIISTGEVSSLVLRSARFTDCRVSYQILSGICVGCRVGDRNSSSDCMEFEMKVHSDRLDEILPEGMWNANWST